METMKKMNKRALAVGTLFLLSACGGGGSGSAPATEDGLRDVAREMSEKAFSNPEQMYDYFSSECRSSISRAEFAGQAMMAKIFLESIVDGREVSVASVNTRNVTDSSGEVQVIIELDGEVLEDDPGYTPFVYEDGAWKSNDCPDADPFGDDDSDSDAPSDTVGGELRSSDDVLAEEAVQGTDGNYGTPVQLDGVTVTLDAPTVVVSDERRLRTNIRVENRLTEELWYVSTNIICAGNPEGGSWGYESTFNPMDEIPSASYSEGSLDLTLPNPSYSGDPPPCNSPAHIVIRPVTGSFDDVGQAVYRIPDDVLEDLNG